jgi:23S rRNA (adenine2030-N6)-methyltransferase
MATAVIRAWKKWSTGVYALWYPLKRPEEAAAFGEKLVEAGIKRVLRIEIDTATWSEIGPLTGCGMIVVNPPFPLENEARIILPWMTNTLSRDAGARWRVDWRAGE